MSLKSSSFGIPPSIKITFLEIDSSAFFAESIFVDFESLIKSIPLYEIKCSNLCSNPSNSLTALQIFF